MARHGYYDEKYGFVPYDDCQQDNLYSESEAKHIFSPSEPITNADRIRAMTDEKLAKYLAWLEDPQSCYVWELYENTETISDWLEWLKQECES